MDSVRCCQPDQGCLQPLLQAASRLIGRTGDFDDATAGGSNLKGFEANPRHQTPRNAVALLLIGSGEDDPFRLSASVVLAESAGPDNGPIQATALQPTLTQSFPHQNQAEQVQWVQPTAGAEGTHQHHPLKTDGPAGLNLSLHPSSVHLQRTGEIDR